MKFPFAAKGVKKIFSAEILKLIAIICTVACVISFVFIIAAYVGQVDIETGKIISGTEEELVTKVGVSAIAFFVLAAAAFVLLIIGFIIKLVGLSQSARDEATFRGAIACVFIEAVAIIVSGFFVSGNFNEVDYQSLDTNSITAMTSSMSFYWMLTSLANLLITIFIITGIIRLADQLNNGAVGSKGNNVLKIIIVVNLLAIISSVVAMIFGSNPVTAIICLVLIITALVLQIVQYFMYLSLLSTGKKMLEKS